MGKGAHRATLVRIDLDSQQRTVIVDDPDADLGAPVISPDGSAVAYVRTTLSTPDRAPHQTLQLLPLGDGPGRHAEPRTLVPDWDRWTTGHQWLPDGTGLLVTADQDGRAPVFHIDVEADTVEQLTNDDYSYSDVQVAPDAGVAYALRASWLAPAHPVRIHLVSEENRPRGSVTVLRAPAPPPTLPGRLTEIRATAGDGDDAHEVRGWLCLPDDASDRNPAPLLLWVHGGPLGSWNSWSWRWNPWLAAAQGYAVLLPDPALSTGYGLAAIKRSWGRWGSESYTDTMAITDAAVARDDIDSDRTAALGGSYGGYMANWIAGHTDRFRGIVSHAGLWALDQFGPTTDAAYYWRREMTPAMAEKNSPHRFVDQIRTPMLVIHGDRDYRVPVGEALRLWADLAERGTAEDGVLAHRFLLFPDENHWVLKPQNAKIWYQSVFAFLANTVHGRPWEAPELLR
jgi:dipeptidyl aminopeptidase/acylaminoacyl peptidase